HTQRSPLFPYTTLFRSKLLSVALRELRYCFKVFAAYRNRRKVTVFGSARLPLSDPSCMQAIEFGRQLAAHDYLVITGAASGIMEDRKSTRLNSSHVKSS